MYEKADVNSIGFLEAIYRYHHKCGLDISNCSDDVFCRALAYLHKIREMEFEGSVSGILTKLFA